MFLNFVDDAVCDPPAVQRLDAFGIAISEDGVVLKGFVVEIFFNFGQFSSGEQQIYIYALEYHFDAWDESFSYFNQFCHAIRVSENIRQDSKEVPVSLNMPRCQAQSINISSRCVNTKSIGAEFENLTARFLNGLLVHILSPAAFLDPVDDNLLKLAANIAPMLLLNIIFKLIIIIH